jgi:hypothetical protein
LAADSSFHSVSTSHLYGALAGVPEGLDGLPAQHWAEALAILLRLMTGLGAVSECSDYGSAPTGGLHAPLEKPLMALESLCVRSRSLVFSDWNANCEVRAVLADLRDGD